MRAVLLAFLALVAKEDSMKITSTAFNDQGAIPTKYTCESGTEMGVSPPLSWDGVPGAAKSLALIVDDPDAPDPAKPKLTWVHWVLYDISPTAKGLPEAVGKDQLPAGTREGLNDWKKPGWGGPCPPIGKHRYFYKLYALDKTIGELKPASKDELLKAMQGHIIDQAQIMGTYEKKKK